MVSITSILQPSSQDDGGRPASSGQSPPPASPRLGNFGAVFDLCFGPVSDAQPAEPTLSEPVGTAPSPARTPSKPSPSPLLSTLSTAGTCDAPSPHTAYTVGFLSGLDLSTIESPSTTPVSLLLDGISEDESRLDEEDEDDDEGQGSGVDGGAENAGTRFVRSPDVVIASASTSPSSSITISASAIYAAPTTPVRAVTAASATKPIDIQTYPAASSGFMNMASFQPVLLQYNLPYPLGSVPVNMGPVPLPASYLANNPVQPVSWNTKEEKLNMIEARLEAEYKRDRALKRRITKADTSLIHVFVDLSNIVIGFYSRLKANRNIPLDKKMRAPPFFFAGLAKILERGRTPVRRVTAGSAIDNSSRMGWPVYMREAEALGYEMNILSRVSKSVPAPKPKASNRYNGGHGGHRKSNSRNFIYVDGQGYSDVYSSDEAFGGSSPSPPSTFKIGEQAVDEILHLKMCHSVLDCDPGTIVLATGDAAEAEFSDGFLKHAVRALDRNWCVELLSWNMGISYAWRELERKQKGTGRFRIIELDAFSEELLAMFSN